MSMEWIQQFKDATDEYNRKCQLLDNELQQPPADTMGHAWLYEQFVRDFGPMPKTPEPGQPDEEYEQWRKDTSSRLQRIVTCRYTVDLDEPDKFEEAAKRLQESVNTMGTELLRQDDSNHKVTLVEGPKIYPRREGYELLMYAWATFYHHLETKDG